MERKIITTKAHRVWVREDGIVHGEVLPNAHIDLEAAQESLEAIQQLDCQKPCFLLVDGRGVSSMTREARSFYSSEETAEIIQAQVTVIGNPVSTVIGNFFLGLSKHPYPFKLETSVEKGLAWLKQLKNEARSTH